MKKGMNARERVLAVATGAVVLVGVVWSQAVEPALSSWKLKSSQVYVLQESLERSREQQAKLAGLREQLLNMEVSLLPPPGVGLVPWFLSHLQELGLEAKFVPSSLRYLRADPLEPESPYAELRFELRAQATAEQLHAFLVRLTASPRHIRVVALGLVPRKASSDELDVNLTLVALAPRVALDQKTVEEDVPR